MSDTFSAHSVGVDGPAVHAFSVTPNDSVDLTYVTRGLYVGASGDVKVTVHGGEAVTFVDLAAGVIHPLRVTRVWSTGTAATGIVGVY